MADVRRPVTWEDLGYVRDRATGHWTEVAVRASGYGAVTTWEDLGFFQDRAGRWIESAVRAGHHFNPHQARDPSGENGGQWVSTGGGAGIRESLSTAKTVNAIANTLADEAHQRTGRRPRVVMDGQSPATAREHAEGVLRGMERFPHVQLTYISRNDKTDQYASAWSPEDGDTRLFFSSHWSTPARRAAYLRTLKADARNGWHPGGTGTPMGVALHEFGHALDTALGHEARELAVEIMFRRAEHPGGTSIGSVIKAEVSRYAAESSAELVAEAFADVMMNGPDAQPASQEIFDLLEELYQRRFGGSG